MRCYPRYDDATNATVIQTSELSATFKGLKPSTDYAIQVRAKTTRGWGEYTPVVYKKTPHAMGLGDCSNSFDRFCASVIEIQRLDKSIRSLYFLRLRRRRWQHASEDHSRSYRSCGSSPGDHYHHDRTDFKKVNELLLISNSVNKKYKVNTMKCILPSIYFIF